MCNLQLHLCYATWHACPETSLCLCGRAVLWYSPLLGSPAGPESDSPWRRRPRPWMCSSRWLPGWKKVRGWSWCTPRGRGTAPASEAGKLSWSVGRGDGTHSALFYFSLLFHCYSPRLALGISNYQKKSFSTKAERIVERPWNPISENQASN